MMRFTDRASVGDLKETKEGYLVATARVARTGVQEYYAAELGDVATKAGFKPTDVVKLYRHPDQVFNKDSLATITRIPITINHPLEDVNKDNWNRLAIGEVGDSYALEPEWVVVNPMIKDAKGIKAAKTTHKELSLGYDANLVVARDGLDADFEVVDIKYNHLCICTKARAGDKARLGMGDSWGAQPITDFQPADEAKKLGGRMPDTKAVILGDAVVQVPLGDVAEVEKYKADMQRKLADAESNAKKVEEEKDEEIGKLKAEVKSAKDAALIDVDKLVADRTELVGKVHAIDAKIVVAGKSDAELRRAAVASKFGDEMAKDASDAEITGMFKAAAKDAKPVNPVNQALQQGVKQVGDAATQMHDAHAKSVSDLNAWRNQA